MLGESEAGVWRRAHSGYPNRSDTVCEIRRLCKTQFAPITSDFPRQWRSLRFRVDGFVLSFSDPSFTPVVTTKNRRSLVQLVVGPYGGQVMVSQLDRRVCWICGRAVALENCKTDEQGFAVHEPCYLARLALANGSKQMSKVPPKPIAYRFKLDMRFAKRL
jgi:hypothetical protein